MKRKRKTAVIHCSGTSGREGACSFGCTGCGACRDACKKDAVRLTEQGAAWIDRELCVGCGLCRDACPQHIISLVPAENPIQVLCANREPAKEARKRCAGSCVGCGTCERSCPAGAMRVTDNCAAVSQEVCNACGMCAVKCPRGAIFDARGILTEWPPEAGPG